MDERKKPTGVISPPLGTSIVAVPHENWDEPRSGVHDVAIPPNESQLDTITRIARDSRNTGHSTVTILKEHDAQITALGLDVAEIKTRMPALEGIATSIKSENLIQTAKLDTILKIMDPAAPQRVREIVATELRISDRTAEQQERQVVTEHKQKFKLTALQGVISVATALVTAGVVGALINAHC